MGEPQKTGRLRVELTLEQPKSAFSSWYVQVVMEGADLERPVKASAGGSGTQGEAQLELETVTGGPRRLSAVLFLFGSETVDTWSGSLPDIYLAAGDQTVSMQLVRRPTLTLTGEITLDSSQPARVWAEDLATRVAFPAAQTLPQSGGFHAFTLESLPQGRFLRVIVQDVSGAKRSFDDCPLRGITDDVLTFAGNFTDGTCHVQ